MARWIEVAHTSKRLHTNLLKQTLSWEGNLIETPKLIKQDGKYVLFYSTTTAGPSTPPATRRPLRPWAPAGKK